MPVFCGTELLPVHRAFSLRYTELFPTSAQSFLPPVHRAQHLLHRAPPNDTELLHCGTQGSSPLQPPSRLMIHRAFSLGAQSFVLAAFATLVCQRNCVFLCKGTKLKIVMPVFCGTELRFGIEILMSCANFGSLCNLGLSKKLRFSLQRHKTREFGEAEFSDCLPVSALVCVFAFVTGGLGLWLGAFGRSRLYRCQSTPGPLMPCFVTQSFVLAAFATLICQINSVFPCKDTKAAKSVAFCDSLPVFCGTELRFCVWKLMFYQ